MEREQIIEKFQNLNIWEREGERAPHKPLLVLHAIGKLLRDESRLTSYTDVEKELPCLLKEFGPRRKSYRSVDPFWRLQNDEIWEVTDADKIYTHKGNASITDLRKYRAAGGFTETVAEQLKNDVGLTFEIVVRLLASHFPDSYFGDILQDVGIELSFKPITQPRDPKFRQNILEAYKHRCAICGFNIKLGDRPVALEAAHIRWRMADGPDKPENGMALCTLHHKLFDRGVFTLSERLEVQVSEHVDKKSVGFEEWLMRFDGREINVPQETTYHPHEDYTRWHVKEVFKG